MLEDPRCQGNETRVANREFVDGALQQTFAELTYAVISQRLAAADVAFAPLNLCRHCSIMATSIPSRCGCKIKPLNCPCTGLPVSEGFTPRVPELGADTEAVMQSLAADV